MLKRLFSYVREYKKSSLLAPLFVAIETLIEIFIPFLMASIIDNGLSKGDTNHIIKIGMLTLMLAMISLVCGILAGRYAAHASAGFAKNLRTELYQKIQQFSFTNIDKFSTAGLITRFTTDVNNIQNSYQMVIRVLVRAPFMLIFATIMTIFISGSLSWIFLAVILFLATALAIIISKVHPIFSRAVQKYDKINLNLQENISAIRVVKAFVREQFEIEKFKHSTKDLRDTLLKGEKIVVFLPPIMQFSTYMCILLLSWFGAHMIASNNLTTGELMSLFTYTATILMSLMMLAMILVTLGLSIASGKRLVAVLDEEPTIKEPTNPIYDMENGDIEFRNVNFSYTNNKNLLNLENININIKSGETIGIIGGTGSSKSALVQLIPRLYDTISGQVIVSGNNVKDYELKTIRDNIAMVLQKNILFSGTIKENLKWGNENATDKEVINACKLAQADEFIQKFPDKYDTLIERGATNVSGGQKQRLCIARALLKNPKILILDDSTSALDTKTDSNLRNALKLELPNITKIIVSQRIASIKDCDKIIVLEDGKLNGIGTHDELLETNNIYKEVYYSQTKGGK